MLTADERTSSRAGRLRFLRLFLEILVLVPAYLLYHLVRGAVDGRVGEAFRHAAEVVRLERALGIFWEVPMQQFIINSGTELLTQAANMVYILGHMPLIAVLALWIFFFRRHWFSLYRNAFLLSGAIGLVFYLLLPTAPPRFLPHLGFVDTVTAGSNAYRVLQPEAFVNQYAAMPSLHFGWNLLVGIAVFQLTRSWLGRSFGVVIPLLMLAAVVLTANHFILDAVLGGVVALLGLAGAWLLRRRFSRDPLYPLVV